MRSEFSRNWVTIPIAIEQISYLYISCSLMLPTNGDFESSSGPNKIMHNSHVAIR